MLEGFTYIEEGRFFGNWRTQIRLLRFRLKFTTHHITMIIDFDYLNEIILIKDDIGGSQLVRQWQISDLRFVGNLNNQKKIESYIPQFRILFRIQLKRAFYFWFKGIQNPIPAENEKKMYFSSSNLYNFFRKFWLFGFFSPNPLLMCSANVKDSENADRWLAALSCSIVH